MYKYPVFVLESTHQSLNTRLASGSVNEAQTNFLNNGVLSTSKYKNI